MTLRVNIANLKLYILILILLFVYFFPFFPSVTNHIGEFLCFCFSLILLIYVNFYSTRFSSNSLFIFIILFLLLIFSLLYDNNRNISRDYLEVLRPLYWLISFNIFYNVTTYKNSKKIIKILFSFLFSLAIWGIVESLINIPAFFHSLYKFNAPVYYNKAITSLIAPYSYGSIMGVGLIYSFIRYRYSRDKTYFYFSIIFLLSILLSQSKSAIVASVFVLCILNLVKFSLFSFLFNLFSISALAYLVVYTNIFYYVSEFIFAVYKSYNTKGFQDILNSSDSISNRIEQVQIMVREFDHIPILGMGIGKSYLYVESFFILLYRYGLIGLVVIGCVVFHTLKVSENIKVATFGTSIYYLCLSFPYFFIFLLITSFSANIIDQFRVCFIYIGILGIIHSVHQNLKFIRK